MKHKIILLAIAAFAALEVSAARPRLVVNIVVGSMRAEDLSRYADNYGEGGLRRLIDGGTVFADSRYDYQQTTTPVSLATLSTGAAAFVNIMHHLCKSQYDFRLTERDFQQFHHLIIGQLSRTDQKAFQHSGTGAKTMHTLSPIQLRHPAFKDLLPVLTSAQLLLCFGFFAAEVGKVGFGLGHSITLLLFLTHIGFFLFFVGRQMAIFL